MEKLIYEKMLHNDQKDYETMEAFWNARAKQFNRIQQEEKSGFVDQVLAVLSKKKILPGAKVLDVGGGSGRYAIPFASQAEMVTVTDLSSNMLELAEKNAGEAGFGNMQFKKMEWSNADIAAIGWGKNYDLVFASMCPAVHSIKGLKNMSLASKKYCVLNQFIKDTDSVSEYLAEALELPKNNNPHNDRDSVQGFFNLLWLDGYEPEIRYLRMKDEAEISDLEAASFYAERYKEAIEKYDTDIETLLQPLKIQNKINVVKEKTAAMILWEV